MNCTYYGHSCFSVLVNDKHLLFDPFITPNEYAKHIDLNSIKADYIFISHGHADHIADTIALANSTQALVVASWEVCEWLQKHGVTNTHPMNTGGQKLFDFGAVKCVVAQHSSGLPDGSYGGNPMGFLVTSTQGSFYYSGDTALTLDMQLIPLWASVDVAILPIGDNFTMGASDAALAANMVKTKKVVGVHFDTFPYIVINKEAAVNEFNAKGLDLKLPNIGETFTL
jgi:L-ascorbate metabolism protein UlaG (beta-lactamase superfamily)